MSIFKDMQAADIDNVLFNTDETATLHNVKNFGRIPIEWDDNWLLEKPDVSPLGMVLGERRMFVKAKDMGKRLPDRGEDMVIDNISWRVTDAKDDCGVYEIRLRRYSQGRGPWSGG